MKEGTEIATRYLLIGASMLNPITYKNLLGEIKDPYLNMSTNDLVQYVNIFCEQAIDVMVNEVFAEPQTEGGNTMSNDLVTPENLSKELLHSIFDAAFMEPSWDSDGDLFVKDDIHCFVLLTESRDGITLLSIFNFEEGTTQTQRLECVNNINKEYIMVRAFLANDGTLRFTHDLYVKGGMTAKNLVLVTKFFMSIPLVAVKDHGKDIVK